MACLLHHMSLVAPAAISLLLLLAALAPAASAAAEKKAGTMRIGYAEKEAAQWLDRYAATHQPLGAGPLRMVRATPEEEYWLNRLSSDAAATDDGENGGFLHLDDDNPYVHAVRDWVLRLIKQSMDKAQMENLFKDL